MNKTAQFLKEWMLPLAIVTGISLCVLYHLIPALRPVGPFCHTLASEGQRVMIALLLFFQFVKISPHDLRLRRWHLGVLLFQIAAFLCLAAATVAAPEGAGRILLECAMLCLICPTASAAGVITERLGGNLADTVTYLVLVNVAATFLIPAVIPLVSPSDSLGFWQYVFRIAGKVFPILILPCLVAWLIRYTAPTHQRKLMRWSGNSFYIWGFCLTLGMVLATHSLFRSHLGIGVLVGIVVLSILTCVLQFYTGRRIGRGRSDSLTAGQALGQKNTGFLIWLGYNYLTPVTSVAGGLYAIWQNLFNSWELYRHERRQIRASRNTSTIDG